MPKDLIARYVWIVDTLTRHEFLTRDQINRLWLRSSISNGDPLPERTFFHYRRAIEEIFQLDISCDRQGRYYINREKSRQSRAVTNWMLDSYAVSSAIGASDVPAGSVEIEDVPSSREFLPTVLEAIRTQHKLSFTYLGFNRSRVEHDILYRPYFLKRYKQRWYMIGFREKSKDIRTYALDRVKQMVISEETFLKPGDFDLDELFGNIIGVTTSHAPIRTVRLQVSPIQAKYFRALPLHRSQKETEVCDSYSIFEYELKLNYELAHELLSFGDSVKVLDPPELRAMVVTQLQSALEQY